MAPRPTMYCEMCRSTIYSDDIHSCYDFDAVDSLRVAERAVINAAVAWDEAWLIASVNDCGIGPTPLDYCVRQLHALSDAVRSLREVTP